MPLYLFEYDIDGETRYIEHQTKNKQSYSRQRSAARREFFKQFNIKVKVKVIDPDIIEFADVLNGMED